MKNSRRMFRTPLAGVTVLSLLAAGCPNTETVGDSATVLSYPHVLALMPEELPELDRGVAPHHTSGRALAVTEENIFAVDQGNGALVIMDRESMEVVRAISVGSKPEQVVVDPRGDAYVTVRDTGEVVRVRAGASTVDARVTVGLEAWGIARHPDKPLLYVTEAARASLVVVDALTLEVVAAIDLDETSDEVAHPSPRGVAVRIGEVAVTHQYGGASVVTLTDGLPGDVDHFALRQGSPTDRAIFPTRAKRIRATHALAATTHPGGGTFYVSHSQVTPGDEADLLAMASGLQSDPSAPPPIPQYYGPELQADTYGTPTRPVEVGVTALNDRAFIPRPPVKDRLSGEPMTHLISDPSDVNHHPTWGMLFVTGFGSDNVIVFSSDLTDPMASPIAEFKVGQAPKAVAFSPDGRYAYVLNAHDYTVSTLALEPLFDMRPMKPVVARGVSDNGFPRGGFTSDRIFDDPLGFLPQRHTAPLNLRARQTVPFGVDPLPDELKRGRRVFTFARNDRLSRAGHFSCSTCHFEGREDKLTWVVTVGPRQTPALAGRLHDTAPFNWNGTKDHLQTNMARTVDRMGGSGLTAGEKSDLEAFILRGLDEPRNPNIADQGELTPIQQQGMGLFFGKGQCGTCHVGGDSVDAKSHAVGTLTAEEEAAFEALAERGDAEVSDPARFNTPSLRGLFYTAPYLHDGSARTLRDALTQTKGEMGNTLNLSDQELDAIVEYMKTL